MFKAALFIFPPNWNQLNCPPRNERINKLWYICTTEYYSTIQNSGLWIHITCVTLKKSLDRKGYDCILPFIWSSRIGKDWKRLWRSFQGSWKCSVSPKCLGYTHRHIYQNQSNRTLITVHISVCKYYLKYTYIRIHAKSKKTYSGSPPPLTISQSVGIMDQLK